MFAGVVFSSSHSSTNMYSCLAVLTELLYIGLSTNYETQPQSTDEDLIIGGLFPVHEQGENGQPCGRLMEGRGIQRVEAMLFAIDSINRDPDILPGIRLGARIFDSCSNPSYALNLSLTFVRDLMGADVARYHCSDGSIAKMMDNRKAVAGVIGGSYSGVSIQTAHLLRLFNIVQISPASTNADLSDKSKFDLFARTVPSDLFQAQVLADIARRYNWTYVSLVYSAGEYGELGAEAFKKHAKNLNVCIGLEEKIAKYQDLKSISSKIVKAAKYKPVGPTVVVLFTRTDDTRQLLRHVSKIAPTGLITWLAADGWEIRKTTTHGWENIAEGALVSTLDAKPVLEFERYFLSLRPHSLLAKRNPWFNEFWREKFNCAFGSNELDDSHRINLCKEHFRLEKENFEADDKIQMVIDAVYALAKALHRMMKTECKGFTVCNKMKPVNGSDLYRNYLMNVSFINMVGNLVNFDKHGDGPAYYKIMNYRRIDSTRYDYVDVGSWRTGTLIMHDDLHPLWNATPISRCSLDCKLGYRKELVKGDSCCWGCVPCGDHQYNTDDSTCTDCPEGDWPVPSRTRCEPLPIVYMEWTSAFSLVPCCLSSVGLLIMLFITLSFWCFRRTPVIKAAGVELCYLILAGATISYLMVYVLVAKPSKFICGLRRVGVGLGFTIIYSSLLVKTNRIHRIFRSVDYADCRPRFISSMSQLVITGCLVSVQLIGSLIWLAVQPPDIRTVHPTRNVAVLQCTTDDLWFLVSLSYDAFLVVVCTIYAFKTRGVPENFNEAKFIGFTMYTTCIIWLAFVPLYFGTDVNFRVQITTLGVCICLSATVPNICLFGPKLWIVFLEPEKNVRRPSGAWLGAGVQEPNDTSSPLLGHRHSSDKSIRTPSCSSVVKEDAGTHPYVPLLKVQKTRTKSRRDILDPL